jgi:hypothetical protein
MIFDKLKSVIQTPTIEFLCQEEDAGVIPEPYPARKLMPDWYKHLAPKIDKLDKLENSTIKRCPPFLDAMVLGWIIPLAADVEFITTPDASGVTYKHMFYKPMIENHSAPQVAGNPHAPKPPMKFLNYWAIKVPVGWSVLFLPPMNRPDFRFECVAGMVDCDGYFEFINFPFFFKEKNYTGILKAGTPLVQAIPIKRDDIMTKANIRKFNKKDVEELALTRRKRQSHESHYRDKVWNRK